MTKPDNIYANQREAKPFVFNEEVVAVFPDMIDRSVPGYSLTLPLIGLMAARYVQAGSAVPCSPANFPLIANNQTILQQLTSRTLIHH